MTVVREIAFTTLVVLPMAIASLTSPAQVSSGPAQRKRISPHEASHSIVDGARITVVYGRPFMRGRKIWGGLVGWGTIWTPGADEATLVTTDRPLSMAGRSIPSGTYSVYVLVDRTHPQLIINKQTGQWHTVYNQSLDLVHVDLHASTVLKPVEQLTLAIVPQSNGGGLFSITWDTTRYSVPFTVQPLR
jgi:hypothetical protein